VSVSITGKPKSGKNYLAYTFPDPIRVFCFNRGADYIKKFFPQKQIDVINIALPILESTEPSTWATPIWDKFDAQYKKDIASKVYKTYVIDTGTELENVCAQAVLEFVSDAAVARGKDEREKLATNEYRGRNMRMSAVFQRCMEAGCNFVTLQYVREKWIKDGSGSAKPTGEMVLDGWAQTEAQVDIPLEIEEHQKGDKSVCTVTIKANRFDRTSNRKTYDDTSYEELMAVLLGG